MRLSIVCIAALFCLPAVAQPPGGIGANSKVIVPQDANIDLTTPGATLRSFASAINRGDLAQASLCVVDSKPAATLASHPAFIEWKKMGGIIALSEPKVTIRGSLAIVNLNTQLTMKNAPAGGPNAPERQDGERVILSLVNGQWKVKSNAAIFPTEEPQVANDNQFEGNAPTIVQGKGLLTVLATLVANPDRALVGYNSAQRVTCITNLKQLALAAIQYVADNRDVFDLKAPNDPKLTLAPAVLQMKWQKAFFPYAKNESMFLCPLIKQKYEELTKNDPKLQQQAQNLGARALLPAEAYESYAFNVTLEGLKAADIPDLMNTVLIYEGKDGKLDFRHDGKANVAFGDGRVMSVSEEEAKDLVWNPKGKAND